jgi:integrase
MNEKLRLLRVSGENSRWERARLAMLLSLNTTMRAGEIKNLQWRDVDWVGKTVQVRKGKSEESQREIPLNREAYEVILRLREQSRLLFGDSLSPDWYIFFWWPGTGKADALRPAKSWRSAWRSMVHAAGIGHLRFHDLRHQTITELSGGQASDETIMSIAGILIAE